MRTNGSTSGAREKHHDKQELKELKKKENLIKERSGKNNEFEKTRDDKVTEWNTKMENGEFDEK